MRKNYKEELRRFKYLTSEEKNALLFYFDLWNKGTLVYEDLDTRSDMFKQIFEKMKSNKFLTPLTGDNEEWNEVTDGLYQNNRVPNLFKEEGKLYLNTSIDELNYLFDIK